MFGFLMANQDLLSEDEKERYRGCYCGLCKILGSRHHVQARFTVTYDMVFLILLLSSLYEPEEHDGKEACIIHPFKAGMCSLTDGLPQSFLFRLMGMILSPCPILKVAV